MSQLLIIETSASIISGFQHVMVFVHVPTAFLQSERRLLAQLGTARITCEKNLLPVVRSSVIPPLDSEPSEIDSALPVLKKDDCVVILPVDTPVLGENPTPRHRGAPSIEMLSVALPRVEVSARSPFAVSVQTQRPRDPEHPEHPEHPTQSGCILCDYCEPPPLSSRRPWQDSPTRASSVAGGRAHARWKPSILERRTGRRPDRQVVAWAQRRGPKRRRPAAPGPRCKRC